LLGASGQKPYTPAPFRYGVRTALGVGGRRLFLGHYLPHLIPVIAQAIANAIEVDPLDASTTTVEAPTSPDSMACATMSVAIRSFVHPLGRRYSSFNQIVQPESVSG